MARMMVYQKPRPKTERKRQLMDTISALQKEIRRGNEEGAFYWLFEMLPRYEVYVWRRLLVISHEDIGIANPDLPVQLQTYRDQYFEFRSIGKNGTCRLILANAILLMCRSPKSRIADHFQRHMVERWKNEDWDIPDYALDQHTSTGRSLGRGPDHWIEIGCLLHPEPTVPDPYLESATEHWRAGRKEAPEWQARGPRGYGKQTSWSAPEGPDQSTRQQSLNFSFKEEDE